MDLLEERVDPRGKLYYWIGGDAPVWEPEPESDFVAVDQGRVSVTPLHLLLTDEPLRSRLGQLFGPPPVGGTSVPIALGLEHRD